MDDSETYIKMCQKSTEIQGLARRKHWHPHDYFYYPPHKTGINSMTEPGVAVIGDAEDCGHCLSYYTDYLDTAIWLPRQDQLQEMVRVKRPLELAHRLYRWAIFNGKKFTSMEQLWLTFVMRERYKKRWDGDNWV